MTASIFDSRAISADESLFAGPRIEETLFELKQIGDVPDLNFQLNQIDDWTIYRFNTGNISVLFTIGQVAGKLHRTGVRVYNYRGPRTNDAIAVIFQHERELRQAP
jgi:hypothetical protein